MSDFKNKKLLFNSSWSIGEEAFAKIINIIEQKIGEPKTILEFGGGISSIRLAIKFPNSKIISIENDRLSFQETKFLAERYLQQNNLELQYTNLEFRWYGFSKILSYAQMPYFDKKAIDCVIIDGPSFYTLRGREACLYQIYQQLSIGGLVILDDYCRKSEKIIVQNWMSVYPQSFDWEIIEIGHHLAILQKVKSVRENWHGLDKFKDSQIVLNRYQKIQLGLLYFQDKFILSWLKFLSFFGISIDDSFRTILAVREAYGITNDQIDRVIRAESKLSLVERSRLMFKKIQAFFEISILLFKGLFNI